MHRIRLKLNNHELEIESSSTAFIQEKMDYLLPKLTGAPVQEAPATRKEVAASSSPKEAALPVEALAEAVMNAPNSKSILDGRDRTMKVLLILKCGRDLGKKSMTAREIEYASDSVGAKIAQSNIAKTLRSTAKRLVTADRSGAAAVFSVNRQGEAYLDGGGKPSSAE